MGGLRLSRSLHDGLDLSVASSEKIEERSDGNMLKDHGQAGSALVMSVCRPFPADSQKGVERPDSDGALHISSASQRPRTAILHFPTAASPVLCVAYPDRAPTSRIPVGSSSVFCVSFDGTRRHSHRVPCRNPTNSPQDSLEISTQSPATTMSILTAHCLER